jgi:hypothetical protein
MDKIMQDLQFDEQMVLQSMRDECLIPAEVDVEIGEREEFYANYHHRQLAKSATFSRQDAALSLMTATRLRRDVRNLRGLIWVVIFLLGYIAYKVS